MKTIATFRIVFNNFVAGLVLKQGVVGVAAQVVVHSTAFLLGRQPAQRTVAGIRRALAI